MRRDTHGNKEVPRMPGPYRGEWFLGALSVPICFPDPIPMTNLIDSATNRAFFFFFNCYWNGPLCLAQTIVILLCLGLYPHPHSQE